MKIFLSWSGRQSYELARALKKWLPTVLPYAKPWMSDQDIPPGQVWFDEIRTEIDASQYAIVCVTTENLKSQWLLWESGALYGKIYDRTRVVPLLAGLTKSQLQTPLSLFQLVESDDSDEFGRLLRDINRVSGEAISDDELANGLTEGWPLFQQALQVAIGVCQPYAITWNQQIALLSRLCGDPQKIGLFMVNTGATIDQTRYLRWGTERVEPDGRASFFVLRDKPAQVLVLNSIAKRIIGYMRGRYEDYVFGPPDEYTWIGEACDSDEFGESNEKFADSEGIEALFNHAWAAAGLPVNNHIQTGLGSLRATFEHRLLQEGTSREDVDTLLGCNPNVTNLHQIPVKHLLSCVEKICKREKDLDWIPR